jgi:predicted O-methyltransferase YrrM
MITKNKLLELAGRAEAPLGDPFLDGLFNLATTAIYYRFMFHLAAAMQPALVVELGVCTGRSTAHLAAGCPSAAVIGIDPGPQDNPDMTQIRAKYKNICLIRKESTDPGVVGATRDGSVDLCFVDTIHSYKQVMDEFKVWLPKMRPGGVMLFDDITENSEMPVAWAEITSGLPEDKFVSLPQLHHSGFGVILV